MDTPRFKTIFLSLVILTSLIAFIPFQNSFESQYTKSISSGSPVVTFRDITNLSATVNATESLDESTYSVDDTATITVTDSNADVDIGAIDFTSAIVTMTSATTVTLTESGANTGVFTGTFTVDAAPSVDYTADSPEAARATITLPVSPGGSVTISDAAISDSELNSAGLNAVTGAIEITLSAGATFTTVPTVVMSFANANLDGAPNALGVEMWHKSTSPNGIQGWEQVTENCSTLLLIPPNTCPHFDNGAMTLTSNPAGTAFGNSDGQGLYILAFEVGSGGGGGGGLVRPGLVVNALAGFNPGAAGGGGGGLPGPTITLGALSLNDNAVEILSVPQEIRDFINNDFDPYTPLEPITEIYEDFDLPLSINGNSFALGGYENTLVSQTVEPGKPIEFTLVFYTTSEIAHTSLNFNLGPTRLIAGSDTQVLLYKDKFEIVDPNGNIATATGSINNENDNVLKRVATFSVTFSDDIQWSNSDMVIRSWNDNLNSGDIIVYDAIEIAQPEIVEIADEDIPEPEIQTLKSQYVPIWIKNNAAWWSQELIEDSDFVAGIEYLIQNEIITIQDNEIIAASYSSNEIPVWIKNNAGWWSEDLITEKEFIDGLQWLISNGIIQVTET